MKTVKSKKEGRQAGRKGGRKAGRKAGGQDRKEEGRATKGWDGRKV
jgi:hypothetical protein